jgi:hypothetical protein
MVSSGGPARLFSLLLHIQGHLARHGEGLDGDAEISFRTGHGRPPIQRQRPALHDGAIQAFEDGIGIKVPKHAAGGPKGEGLALAKGKETRHIVDLASRQHHGLDGGIAKPAGGRPQPIVGQNLLPQIRRRVDDDPVLALSGYGDGSLCP